MKVIETSREATSAQVITIGKLCRNSPVVPFSSRNGTYATMLVIVANRIACASFVGPSHAATTGGWYSAKQRLIESPATTGSSTSSPSAIINVAMDTCCRSTPNTCANANVIASVIGIEMAISTAERHSQNPISETITTSTIASYSASMKRSTFSFTCRGWSEVEAMIRSEGSKRFVTASFPARPSQTARFARPRAFAPPA